MDDKPSQVLRKGGDTSMWSALESVRSGEALAAVSCGNTGALMALSMLRLRKLPGVPLIAVELQASMARRLQARFPAVDVRQASAKQVVDGLIDRPGRLVLVSSLPFRSLPKDVGAETVDSICRFLAHSVDRKLVQFTYQPRAPFAAPRGLRWHRRAVVWRNTPPAGIWELQAAR